MLGRSVAVGALSAALVMAMAPPAGAAPATGGDHAVVDVADHELVPGLGDVLEDGCAELGYDVGQVQVFASGWSRSQEFRAQQGTNQQLELTVYHYELTAVSDRGTTATGLDVGPDRVSSRDGRVLVSVTGRSLSGTGVVGRVVLDVTEATPTVVSTAGSQAWLAPVCAELAADPA